MLDRADLELIKTDQGGDGIGDTSALSDGLFDFSKDDLVAYKRQCMQMRLRIASQSSIIAFLCMALTLCVFILIHNG